MAALCNLLRAAKVDVDRIAAMVHVLGGFEQNLRVIAGKLDAKRPIVAKAVEGPEYLLSVERRFDKLSRGEHRRVG